MRYSNAGAGYTFYPPSSLTGQPSKQMFHTQLGLFLLKCPLDIKILFLQLTRPTILVTDNKGGEEV